MLIFSLSKAEPYSIFKELKIEMNKVVTLYHNTTSP